MKFKICLRELSTLSLKYSKMESIILEILPKPSRKESYSSLLISMKCFEHNFLYKNWSLKTQARLFWLSIFDRIIRYCFLPIILFTLFSRYSRVLLIVWRRNRPSTMDLDLLYWIGIAMRGVIRILWRIWCSVTQNNTWAATRLSSSGTRKIKVVCLRNI